LFKLEEILAKSSSEINGERLIFENLMLTQNPIEKCKNCKSMKNSKVF
jgi:hypothetical protein